jgi:hypothetical protein
MTCGSGRAEAEIRWHSAALLPDLRQDLEQRIGSGMRGSQAAGEIVLHGARDESLPEGFAVRSREREVANEPQHLRSHCKEEGGRGEGSVT